MRLIDSNGSYTLNASDNTGYSLGFGGGIISVADEYGHIVAEFFADDVPTIEAEPVKHGRWGGNGIPESMLSKCSVCDYSCGAYSFNYCPNCGAKMMKEKTDG